MVKHVIIWKLKEEYTKEEKENIKAAIKEGLESLQTAIPGLLDIKIHINGLDSSNGDLMLDSSFENEEALKAYAVNPKHVLVADTKVRPYTAERKCFDFKL